MAEIEQRSAFQQLRQNLARLPAREQGTQLWREMRQDEVTTRAAAFAYHWTFAIPPLLILIVVVASLLNRVTDIPVVENLRELIVERASPEMQDVLLTLVDNAVAEVGGGTASFGLLLTVGLALWAGANGIVSLIEAFNRAYGVEEDRSFLRQKGLAIGLTLLVAGFINLAFALLVFGRRIGDWIAESVGLGSVFDVLWTVLRWPVAIGLIVVLLALLYYFGPNVEQTFRWISPGAVLATVLWLLAVLGFGVYLRFVDPGSAYGVLGSVIVLLFFLYVTGIIFLVGAEVNAILGRTYDPETVRDLATSERAEPEVRAAAQRRAGEAT